MSLLFGIRALHPYNDSPLEFSAFQSETKYIKKRNEIINKTAKLQKKLYTSKRNTRIKP